MKVAIFGTYPTQMNGYSKVVYELMNQLAKHDPFIQLSIFGFQNTFSHPNHRLEIPENVYIHDAAKHENPKAQGFGFSQVKEFVATQRPDVIVIYNDMIVISNILNQIDEIPDRKFKIILYVDQVYPSQRKEFINIINKYADAIILFSKYWETCIIDQGITVPTYVLEHGFNKDTFFPVPTEHARKYFDIKEDDFIVLNLNRNQPRKRWDICIKVWAEIVSQLKGQPIKLLIGTSVNGAWDLLDIYERELKKRNISLNDGMKHLILLDNAQLLNDTDINILYNATNLGITTCDGEGWGLCSFEHAAIGVAQIAPRIGGFLEFFNDDNATLIDPIVNYYVDFTRDMVGGEASICNYMDFVDAIKTQFQRCKGVLAPKDDNLAFRKHVIETYNWNRIGDKLVGILESVTGTYRPAEPELPVEHVDIKVDDAPHEDHDETVSINGCIADKEPFVTRDEFNELNTKMDMILKMLSSSKMV